MLAIVRRLGAATATDVRRYARDLSTGDAADLLARLARAGVLQITETTHKGTPRYSLSES